MNLRQFFTILRARWVSVLLTLVIVVGLTTVVSLLIPPRYTATATVVLDFKGIDPISGAVLPMLPLSGYLATQIDIIKSHKVARDAVDRLKLVDNPFAKELYLRETGGMGNIRDWLAELLLKYLEVEPARESAVVNISYSGNEPRFSAAVANAIVQSYINTNLELKVGPAQQTSEFFNAHINTLKANVERTQAKLSEYQRTQGIIATDERLDVENTRLNELSSQLVAAQAQTYDSVGRYRQVQEIVATGQIPDTLPDVLANPVIQSLKTTLTQLEIRRNELESRLGQNHPSLRSVIAEMAGVRQKLLDEMKTISVTLGSSAALAQRREEQIRAALAAQRAKVLQMKAVRDDQTVLLRELENAQRAYDAAMGRMTQTKLESQTTHTNVLVINEAIEPIEPSSPILMLNIALATFLGMFLGVCFAMLREMSDRVVRSDADLGDVLPAPVLGALLGGPKRRGARGRLSGPGISTPQAG